MIAYIALGLFIFGFLYNLLVGWLEREGYHEAIIAVLVVLWVLVTGVGFGVLRGREEMEWLFICFFASGTWMFVGSYYRYVQELKQRRKDAEDHCNWCWKDGEAHGKEGKET